MSDPAMIESIKAAVTIPVMAKCRIGHFVEAQVLQSLGVDYIDESEVLTPADEAHHVDKWASRRRSYAAATDLGEALRRISEGAALIRSKGRPAPATSSRPCATSGRSWATSPASRWPTRRCATPWPRSCGPHRLVTRWPRRAKLPSPSSVPAGSPPPADAALVMQLGAQAVFVGSGIFKSADPAPRAKAIVEATTHFRDPEIIGKVSRGLGDPMRGEEISTLGVKMADRGW